MANHFLQPPFSMSPPAAQVALEAVVAQFMENCQREGIVATAAEARTLVTSGEDWWASVEITRDWLAVRRLRPKYVTLDE